ncbi:MAG TPA: hypothetical protein VF519_06790 [Mycobacteriales bacterium]|jgi:hypothetical protein
MLRTALVSLGVAAAALTLAGPAAANGPCTGTYDTNCYMYVCNRNCLEVQCAVYTNVVPGQQNGCIG